MNGEIREKGRLYIRVRGPRGDTTQESTSIRCPWASPTYSRSDSPPNEGVMQRVLLFLRLRVHQHIASLPCNTKRSPPMARATNGSASICQPQLLSHSEQNRSCCDSLEVVRGARCMYSAKVASGSCDKAFAGWSSDIHKIAVGG